jgi:hypothetical protein
MPLSPSTVARQQLETLLEEAKDQQEVIMTNANGDLCLRRVVSRTQVRETLPTVKVGF